MQELFRNVKSDFSYVGDEFEEKMEAIHKLEEVADYLKDALGRGIEF